MTSREIVLIHGLIGHLKDRRFHPGGKWSVHTPDLIGYGGLADVPVDHQSLAEQAAHVMDYVRGRGLGPVHLVGHSVGGVVAVLAAATERAMIASITSMEGNFAIEDAFWSATVSEMPLDCVERLIASYRSSPDDWLKSAGVAPTGWTRSIANELLEYQPPRTIKDQAGAVVSTTSSASYLRVVDELLSSDVRFNLVAGERSAAGWHVPDWVMERAATYAVVADAGHLLMLDNPDGFANAIITCCEATKERDSAQR